MYEEPYFACEFLLFCTNKGGYTVAYQYYTEQRRERVDIIINKTLTIVAKLCCIIFNIECLKRILENFNG